MGGRRRGAEGVEMTWAKYDKGNTDRQQQLFLGTQLIAKAVGWRMGDGLWVWLVGTGNGSGLPGSLPGVCGVGFTVFQLLGFLLVDLFVLRLRLS